MTVANVDATVRSLREFTRAKHPNLAFGFQALDEATGELFAEEARILSPNAVSKRRREFLGGRMAAREALRHLGLAKSPILKGDHGEPIWPEHVVGAITHTDKLALACAAYSQDIKGLGIDLELEQRFKPELAEAILTPDEFASAKNGRLDLGIAFSAKESTYKAIFGDLNKVIGFQDVEICCNQDETEFTAISVAEFSPAFPVGKTILCGTIHRVNQVILTIAIFR